MKISLFFIFFLSFFVAAEPLLITGQISSTNQQVVTAPKLERWQIQVQWLLDEGAIAKKGDLIAVFDSGSIKTQIKQNEESLSSAKLLLKQTEVKLQQEVNKAKADLEVAKLEVEKAKIEASISSIEVSEYDKGQYQLALERAIFNKVKAEQTFKTKQGEYIAGTEKQKIEIIKIEEELAFKRLTLERVSVKAKFTGQVSHAYHPWNGDKITAGSMVQQAMKVMTLDGKDNYQVLAWVHELDVTGLKKGAQLGLTLDAYPDKTYSGEILSVASQSEKKESWGSSSYHLVKIKFDQQPKHKLLPGMSVRVVVDKEV